MSTAPCSEQADPEDERFSEIANALVSNDVIMRKIISFLPNYQDRYDIELTSRRLYNVSRSVPCLEPTHSTILSLKQKKNGRYKVTRHYTVFCMEDELENILLSMNCRFPTTTRVKCSIVTAPVLKAVFAAYLHVEELEITGLSVCALDFLNTSPYVSSTIHTLILHGFKYPFETRKPGLHAIESLKHIIFESPDRYNYASLKNLANELNNMHMLDTLYIFDSQPGWNEFGRFVRNESKTFRQMIYLLSPRCHALKLRVSNDNLAGYEAAFNSFRHINYIRFTVNLIGFRALSYFLARLPFYQYETVEFYDIMSPSGHFIHLLSELKNADSLVKNFSMISVGEFDIIDEIVACKSHMSILSAVPDSVENLHIAEFVIFTRAEVRYVREYPPLNIKRLQYDTSHFLLTEENTHMLMNVLLGIPNLEAFQSDGFLPGVSIPELFAHKKLKEIRCNIYNISKEDIIKEVKPHFSTVIVRPSCAEGGLSLYLRRS